MYHDSWSYWGCFFMFSWYPGVERSILSFPGLLRYVILTIIPNMAKRTFTHSSLLQRSLFRLLRLSRQNDHALPAGGRVYFPRTFWSARGIRSIACLHRSIP